MEASKTMRATRMDDQKIGQPILDDLAAIVGSDHVKTGPDAAGGFLRSGQQAPGLIVVSPRSTENVQAIIDVARKNKIAIVTCNERYLLPEDLDREGILLDFSCMNNIERIDDRNLVAHIERGVTWDQLNAELKKLGLKTVAPVAANSSSVVESIIARAAGKSAAKYPDYALMNMKLVLGNGKVIMTGSHGLNEEASDGRNEGGPNLSQWYVGADDIFGVVTRASIMLWPICEEHACIIYGFDDLNEALRAMKDIPRTDLGVEFMVFNQASMERILGKQEKPLPAWSLVVGFDGRKKIVAHNADRIRKLMKSYKCQPIDDLTEAMAEKLDDPWMEESNNHTAFYTRYSQMTDLDKEIGGAAQKAGVSDSNACKIIVSFDKGRCVYAVYDWFEDKDCSEAITQLNLSLADQGAFFDRPHGQLARKIYTSIPNHLPVLKHIKSFLDPENILNPGRTIKDEDKQWEPPKSREGEIGLTVDNLNEVKEKLIDAVGSDWVSDNPADLSAYGRDFTTFSGERPNILVMPSSTEEVQKVIRLAYEHGIPMVPQTTGFNHGGLTVSRKGGILLDLRRMDNLCSVDEETMTITVSPAVRMRTSWWETTKYQAIPGYILKPILPLTYGSVSLLSNYVARGAPASTYKYGDATNLTINMTWVLPNGEILKVGPGAVPGVGNLPLNFCAGPEINGMFFNADGQFGICTELTAKLYPEPEESTDREGIYLASVAELDEHKAFCQVIDVFYDLGRENITEFQYKGHPGTFALAITTQIEGTKVMDMVDVAPRHPVGIIVVGYDQEELQIKEEILQSILEKHGLFIIDTSAMMSEMTDSLSPELTRKSLGIKDNFIGTYKGAFQWTAAQVKMDLLPAIALEYDKLVTKYWKTTDPKMTIVHSMTDTAVQGPAPLGRYGPCEFDYWWDQGNPEEVKRATQMLNKTNKLLLKFGGPLWRNMFGSGEYHLPMWGEYFEVLKKTKKAFDPENLMHPDILPITEDYV